MYISSTMGTRGPASLPTWDFGKMNSDTLGIDQVAVVEIYMNIKSFFLHVVPLCRYFVWLS